MNPKNLHALLVAFILALDTELQKLARPCYMHVRHGALTPDKFAAIQRQGTEDLDGLNRQRAELNMAKLRPHDNIQELPETATADLHAEPSRAAKCILMQVAGRTSIETGNVPGFDALLERVLSQHPEVTQVAPLYFVTTPRTAPKSNAKVNENEAK